MKSLKTVHVWLAGPEWLLRQAPIFKTLLSPQETAQAAGLLRPRVAAKFVARRGLLRQLLSSYTGLPAAALRFSRNSYGKPRLLGPAADDLAFNVSQSGAVTVIALAADPRLGIDVEQGSRVKNQDKLVARYFSRLENQSYLALPAARRPRAFLRAWSAKEAFVKALGTGLSFSFQDFDVAIAPDYPAQLLAIGGRRRPAKKWQMRSLDLLDGTAITVACRCRIETIDVHTLGAGGELPQREF